MKRFFAALGFLTVVPLPAAYRGSEDHLTGSMPFFPIVGLVIGFSAAGIAAGCDTLFPPLVSSVMLTAWLAVVHGGLHLDGLSDTADGFFSPYGRDRVLDIMRDSHIGAFGCIVLWGALVFKVAAIASLPGEYCITAVLLAPLAGRCVMVPMLYFLPPARTNGLGNFFSGRRSARESIWAVAVLSGAAWLTAGVAGLIAGGAALIAVALFACFCKRRIGGITGDTIGAASEIAETVTLLTFSMEPVRHLFTQGWPL